MVDTVHTPYQCITSLIFVTFCYICILILLLQKTSTNCTTGHCTTDANKQERPKLEM